MNKRFLLTVVVFIPFFALLGWTLYILDTRDKAVEVVLPIRGYDPRDLLSGHYINYEINIDKNRYCKKKVEVYTFKDKKGKLREWKRGDFACLKVEIPGFKENNWYGSKRFYIPEKYAKKLDALFRKRNNTDMRFEVLYAVPERGGAIPKALLINGVEWQEYLISS